MNNNKNIALITGAGSGIGAETAIVLSKLAQEMIGECRNLTLAKRL